MRYYPKILALLSAEKLQILYYFKFKELLKVIHEVYIAIGLDRGVRILRVLNVKNKNVIRIDLHIFDTM